ncbi:DUF6473 family protein [Phenylobacterium sp. J426]|uniref:DUF6473 family protein n=1 Tax=Phenylobacterium sp. J426 TaxID=2898439 RepID=UPI0021514E3D|nr:DUF6473 family protein [Phenylobacterium sp. J426]MCR5876535.1 DUF6473 family protein [Phenylobacterium sp. J426]
MHLRHAHLHLAADLDIQRIVVVSAGDEERARLTLLERLRDSGFPDAILSTVEVATLVADVLPIVASKGSGSPPRRDAVIAAKPLIYAIVNAPRAGSTYLGDLLASVGLGHAIEHVRGWLIKLLKSRPEGLFDFPRFVRNLILAETRDGVFGTKLISHFITDIEPLLTPPERSFLAVVAADVRLIYLYRRDKLDQAISTHRARTTGVWHATDARAAQQPPADLGADYEAIGQMMAQAERQERELAARLVGLPLVYVDYDDLARDPQTVCRRVAEFLGQPLHGAPASQYVKLADAGSEALRAGYLASGRPVTLLSGETAVAEAAAAAAAAKAALAERAELIRSGHAKSRHGDYQDRHYYLIDYDHQADPRVDFLFRGPRPRRLEQGDYIAFVGASQTLGAFVDRPFARQAAEALGIEALNLGRGGAGPAFFRRGGQVEAWIRNARAVVVQVMAARMSDNAAFSSVEGRALVRFRDDQGESLIDCDRAWQRIVLERPIEERQARAAESRAQWIADMKAIAEIATGPTALLWFASRSPEYEDALASPQGLLGDFPQLVNRAMVDAVAPSYGAYVEVVAPQAQEPTRSAFSGEVLPVIFGGGALDTQTLGRVNHYYPSQAMHNAAAEALIPALSMLGLVRA